MALVLLKNSELKNHGFQFFKKQKTQNQRTAGYENFRDIKKNQQKSQWLARKASFLKISQFF